MTDLPRKNPSRNRTAPVRYEDEPITKETTRRANRRGKTRGTSSDSDDGGHYIVEKILESRRVGEAYEFKIKWAGYPEYEATWEPEKSLKRCQDMIVEFEYNEALRIGPTKQLQEVLGATTQPGSLHYRLRFTDGTISLLKHTSVLAWYERQMTEYFRAARKSAAQTNFSTF